MELKVGDKVLYKEKTYKVIYVYSNKYVEIQKDYKVELVHTDEVEVI